MSESERNNYVDRYIASFAIADNRGNGSWGENMKSSKPMTCGSKSRCSAIPDPNVRRSGRLRIDRIQAEFEVFTGYAIAPEIKQRRMEVAPPLSDGSTTKAVFLTLL